MKLDSLLEAYEPYKIAYDPAKKKNSSSVADFINKNDIPESDVRKATVKAKASAEFKKILDFGYEYVSSALQEKRGTFYFKSLDGNDELTCYVTGQARMARRGGYDNSQFIASPIPTLPPTQVGDLPLYVDVMFDNLKKAFTSAIRKFESRNSKHMSDMAIVDANMKKLGFPEGFRIYLEGSPKKTQVIFNDEGQICVDASGALHGWITIDFGNNADVGKNITIDHVKGVWSIILKGKNVKSFAGLEKLFEVGLTFLRVDCDKISFKELAKIANDKVKELAFNTNPTANPVLSIPSIVYGKVSIYPNSDTRFHNDQNKALVQGLSDVIQKKLDILDFQNDLYDQGLDSIAKL